MSLRHYSDLLPRTFNLSTTVYVVLLSAILYYVFDWNDVLDFMIKTVWNALVFLTPTRLVNALDAEFRAIQTNDDESTDPRMYQSEKSNAMRRIMGLENGTIIKLVQRSRTLSSLGQPRPRKLPGLGNWDNSCYQNSVLQGMASLRSLPPFLSYPPDTRQDTTRSALFNLSSRLNDESSKGITIWTPARLKNMSSWQQQDAQEYFSKVLDEVDKDIAQALAAQKRELYHEGISLSGIDKYAARHKTPNTKSVNTHGKTCSPIDQLPTELRSLVLHSPLEGLLAQRVGCQRCGYVEGLSLVPFTCLTVPLGKDLIYDIRECLNEFTALESIEGVECAKCTLLFAQRSMMDILNRMRPPPNSEFGNPSISPQQEIAISSIEARLKLVEAALDDQDFSESSLKKCQISAKSRVNSTKSRQAVIGRAPEALVLHVNRSQFNELTGMQTKNYAKVKFPLTFNLGPWYLGQPSSKEPSGVEEWNTDPSVSMLPVFEHEDQVRDRNLQYKLRAAVTHYGRHENGHYICYRQSPPNATTDKVETKNDGTWWQLSDQHVFEVTEEEMLDQGGVFMLFYERVPVLDASAPEILESPNLQDTEQGTQMASDATGTPPSRSEDLGQAEPIPGESRTNTENDPLATPPELVSRNSKESPAEIVQSVPKALPTPPPSPKLVPPPE